LYRVGDRLPDALVARDDDKARRYLSTAAAHGNLHAMAKMAEIEFEDKHLLEAMIWAQIYGHYALESKLDQIKTNKPAGYYGDLLHRLYAHFDEKQMPDVIQHLNAFITAHNDDIRTGMSSNETEYESTSTRAKSQKLTFAPMVTALPQHHRDCYAEYLVEFASDGSATQAWILDALPDITVGKDLRAAAMRVRVNAIDGTSPSRFALVPIDFSFEQYTLRKNH
jgi:TPR repeat protein